MADKKTNKTKVGKAPLSMTPAQALGELAWHRDDAIKTVAKVVRKLGTSKKESTVTLSWGEKSAIKLILQLAKINVKKGVI